MHDIRCAKESADHVIVIYHGGKEHCRYPSPRLYKACHEMVECGASAVLCQHSHCIGCYEKFNGSHILYGQGNFHFTNSSKDPQCNEGLLVELDISKSDMDIDFLPVVSTDGIGIVLAKEQRTEKI